MPCKFATKELGTKVFSQCSVPSVLYTSTNKHYKLLAKYMMAMYNACSVQYCNLLFISLEHKIDLLSSRLLSSLAKHCLCY